MTLNDHLKFKQTEIGQIPEDWQVLKLGDILEITSSKRIFMSEYVNNGIPFYRGKEIVEKGKGANISTDLFISEEKFNDIDQKFGSPKNDDILLSSVGTLGVPYLVENRKKFYFKDGNLTWFRNFSKKVVPKFLYYWMLSPTGKNEILGSAIGSTQQALTIESLKRLEIILPALKEQQKIAGVLGALDEKIELNRKMNKTLEQIGQRMFMKFIRKKDDSWQERKLSEIVELISGASYKSSELSESRTALVTLGNFVRGGGFNRSGFKEFTGKLKEQQVVHDGDIIVAHTDVTQKAEIAGVPALVSGTTKYEKVGITMDVVKVNSTNKNISSGLLYFILKSPEFQGFKNGYVSGTTVLHLDKKCIPQYSLMIPKNETEIKKISDVLQPLIDQITLNEDQIETLSQIRDSLLPWLMSGKLRV